MYKVLLVSQASFFDSTAEIPFMFKRAGCKVDVFCGPESWLLSNKYHDNWLPASDEKEIFKYQLLKLVEDKPGYYDWIVLLEDVTIKLMNDAVESESIFKKILPVFKIENREILSSKLGLSKICERYQIATPRFINYTDESNIDVICKRLQFPILLKEDFSFSGIGIQKCEEPSQLQACLDKVGNKNNLVLQEFIEGEDIGIEALFKEGELIMYNCAKVLTYMYNIFSFTTRRKYYFNAEIGELLKHLGKSVGLNSFASIEFIYHPARHIYYLIEVDNRTNSWMPYSRFTSHDFSQGIKKIVKGDLTQYIAADGYKEVELSIFDRDIRRCLKYKDFSGILQWVFNYKGYRRFLPFYDWKLSKRILKKLLHDATGALRN